MHQKKKRGDWIVKTYQTWFQKLSYQEHEEALLYHKHYPQFAS